MWVVPFTVLGFLFPAKVKLSTGDSIRIRGNGGRPVVFSSGLFSLIPSNTYSDLFRTLEKNITIITSDSIRPMNRELFEEIAAALNVETLGLFAHSSFDADILRDSPVLESAVLCDPVVVPDNVFLRRPVVNTNENRILVLKALRSYQEEGGDSYTIPQFVDPLFEGTFVNEYVFPDVGHACLLDDRYSNQGANIMPWLKGPKPRRVTFDDWRASRINVDLRRKIRKNYRKTIAGMAIAHFSNTPPPLLHRLSQDE